MVKLTSSQSRFNPQTASVRRAIEAAIASQEADLHECQIRIDVDLDSCLAMVRCPANLVDALKRLLHNAIDRSPQHSELSISACRTNRGIEIEIADSNPQVDDTPRNAFSRCRPPDTHGMPGQRMSATTPSGFDLYRTRCPQGGQAWTLVLTPRQSLVRAA